MTRSVQVSDHALAAVCELGSLCGDLQRHKPQGSLFTRGVGGVLSGQHPRKHALSGRAGNSPPRGLDGGAEDTQQ
jgi:hypothetical protein